MITVLNNKVIVDANNLHEINMTEGQASGCNDTKEESQFTNCDVLFSAAFKWLKFTGAAFKKKSFETK